jgi:hypothetical protein
MKTEEAARLSGAGRGLIRELLGREEPEADQAAVPRFVDAYEVSAERCLIPVNFNEEMPLYFLDLGGTVLVLAGQWVFDPHTLIVPQATFDDWKCDETFFARFCLRGSAEHGRVLELRVQGASFVQAERLSHPLRFTHLSEFQLLPRRAETIVDDLRKAGLLAT